MGTNKNEEKKGSTYSVPNITDEYPMTKEAYKEIFDIMNHRRPYCPDDFIPQTFFPDLD